MYIRCVRMVFVRVGEDNRSEGHSHLMEDGHFFQGLFWQFLEVIVEGDWLGCDDVDECLDGLLFFLT